MNWKLVFAFAALGIPMGASSVIGMSGIPAALGWTLVAVVCAGQVARRAPGRLFLHGYLVGFLGIVFATSVQAGMIRLYLDNQPDVAAEMAAMATTLSPRTLILVSAPFLGAVGGLVLGLLSWIAAKIETRGAPVSDGPT